MNRFTYFSGLYDSTPPRRADFPPATNDLQCTRLVTPPIQPPAFRKVPRAAHLPPLLDLSISSPYTGPTVNWDTLLTHLRDWLNARELLAEDTHWVVGVSGGPDSSLLLHAMHALNARDKLNWRLHVAHFHHGLRAAEADEDAAFVANLADELGLACFTEQTDIRAIIQQEGGNTEEVARSQRYDFLGRIALKTDSELVAVAHHADDNAETVLHRICRGTGLRGLAGIRELRPIQPGSRVRVVRPLLGIRRQQIEALCATRKLKLRTDSTNRSTEFTRGRIRHSVMPLLAKQLNPQVADALLRLSEHARWLGTYLEDAAARTFESLVVSQGASHITLNTKALTSKQRIIQAEVVRRAVALLPEGESDLSFAHIESVLRLAEGTVSGKEVHLPGPIVVRKQYERLEFRPLAADEPLPELGTTYITCPGTTRLPTLGYSLTAEIVDISPQQLADLRQKTTRDEEWLDLDHVKPPLLVRARQDGDRFHPLGAPGAKTVGDFFTEQKIDPKVRPSIGLLCDQDGPLWVMPLRIDERAKLRPDSSRALHLKLSNLPAQPNAAP